MEFNKETFEKALKATKIVRYQQHFEAVVKSYLEIENQALRQPPVSGQSEQFICPCCGSNKTYKTDAIHCNRCAVTTEI